MYRSSFAFALAMAALAAILLPSSLLAQITFQRTYGGSDDDLGRAVQQTFDGGYVLAGLTYSYESSSWDVYLVKTDPSGETVWTRTYGGSGHEWGNSVVQTADSGYVVAGYTESFGSGGWDVYLVKTDVNGDTQWTRTHGGADDDVGWSVERTADDGYIITGETQSPGEIYDNVYLIKTDVAGDTLWTRTYGGANQDYGYSVTRTSDGGYAVCGGTYSYGAGNGDVYAFRTWSKGLVRWTRTFGGTDEDFGTSIQQTSDSGFIICGCTGSYGAGETDVYLVRTGPDGDTMWTRTLGGVDFDTGYAVRQTADGGFIVAGTTGPHGNGYPDVLLVKTDATGNVSWSRTFGGPAYDWGCSIVTTADGGYAIAGTTDCFGSGGRDIYLIKTDSLGNVAVEEPKASPTRASALSLTCEPNPCRGATTISLKPQASSSKPLTLRVYDAQGRLTRTLTLSRAPYTVWDGRDDFGQPLPSGAYFIRCDVAGAHAATRIVLQR